jgi:hypothetical protein
VYAGRAGGWWKRVTLPGLWFGVAVLCKLSALLYGGLLLVTLEVCHRFATGALTRPVGATLGVWAKKVVGAVVLSVLVVGAVIALGLGVAVAYCGIPEEGGRPFTRVAEAIPPNEPLKSRYERWAEGAGRTPHAVSAFAFQWWWNSRGRPSFLNGTYYPEGYRWYFPELLLMKLPLPVFFLALVSLARPRTLANPFTLAALVLLAALLRANLQTGVRLALPVVALGYTALAVAVTRGYPRRAAFLGPLAVSALAVTSVWVWPHALGYLNQPSGGREAAPRRVSDSNLDWGQGLPDLRAWHAANGEPPMFVWYFGSDPAVHQPPFRQSSLESLPIETGADLQKWIGPRVLAVSCTVLTLHPDTSAAKGAVLAYLKTRRPLARIATFVLYDFRDERNGPPPLD